MIYFKDQKVYITITIIDKNDKAETLKVGYDPLMGITITNNIIKNSKKIIISNYIETGLDILGKEK